MEARHRFHVSPSAESHFSWMRTRLSIERTLMSWVRTSVALIGFGFTIVQFLERLEGMEGVAPAMRESAPRMLGLTLIGAGIAALIISCWQYYWVVRYLSNEDFAPIAGIRRKHIEIVFQTPIFFVAAGLACIGVMAFVTVFFRLA
jgi:putative membrane protein